MHHHALGTALVEGFNDAAQVQAVGLDTKNAHAAHAVEWLEDDVLVLGVKAFDVAGVPRDQRGADELGKLQNGELFRMVAQGARFVEHPGAFPLGLLQQVGAVEILCIKRRVFAHDDSAEVAQQLGPLVRV